MENENIETTELASTETNEINVVAKKEKRETVKKMWSKAVDLKISHQKAKINNAPTTLKIVSVAVPEAAPVLLKVSAFLKSDSGKKLTAFSNTAYDALGEVLKGNFEGAKEQFRQGVQVYSADEAGKVVYDVRNFINNTKTEERGLAR